MENTSYEPLKTQIIKAVLSGETMYRINKRDYNENLYDLFIQIENSCYRIASYNPKNERLIIPFPKLIIPNEQVLLKFIDIASKEIRNEKENHSR